ncbi:hypothetical protein OC845_006576, partial [Tilletia horrida]
MDTCAYCDTFRLRVIYANVRGLWANKTAALWSLANEDTLVFAAETWHMHDGLSTHSDVLLLATPEARARGTVRFGRRHGGLAVWVGPKLRAHISDVRFTPFSISITVAGRVIHAVYLPPATTSQHDKANSFKYYLRPESGATPDVLIGDINVRFGKAFGDHSSGPIPRKRAIDEFCAAGSMTHLHPHPGSTQKSYVDHMFIGPAVRGEYATHKAPYVSDHPYMVANLSWQLLRPGLGTVEATRTMLGPLMQPARRIQLKLLDTERGRKALFWHWCRAYPKVRRAVLKLAAQVEPSNAKGKINKIDRLIGTSLWDVASRALGTYSVSDMKRKPDYLQQGLRDQASAQAAVRLFRRSQRDSQTVLVSRQPDSVPVPDDVLAFYRDVYETSEPGHQLQPWRPLRDSPDPDESLMAACSVDAVGLAIKTYPAARSCGPDGMHHVLIKALAEDGLSHLL